MSQDLSKLLDKALNEIRSRADIQALGNDAETESMMDMLTYESMAEMELQKEHNQLQVADELLHKMQKDVAEMIHAHKAEVERLRPQLNHPLLPADAKKKFQEVLRQNGLVMIISFYLTLGVSERTATALAEAQIP